MPAKKKAQTKTEPVKTPSGTGVSAVTALGLNTGWKKFKLNPDLDREFFARRAKIGELEILDELYRLEKRVQIERAERIKKGDISAATEGLADETYAVLEHYRQMLEKRAVDGQPLGAREFLDAIDTNDLSNIGVAFKTGNFAVFDMRHPDLEVANPNP
jgi:hypothetical protein